MQRYFIKESLSDLDQIVHLPSEDAHHLVRVMRAKIGQHVIIVSIEGYAYVAEIIEMTHEGDATATLKTVQTISRDVELPINVTIACGLSKNDKIDTIVQKATECGMFDFVPLALQRDVVKWDGKKAQTKIARLSKIAKEAAEQSHRVHAPVIHELMNLNTLIETAQHYDIKLIAYEESAKTGEHTQLRRLLQDVLPNQNVIAVFGSEGGLTQDEVTKLEASGFVSCSLGPRILRAETAPIYLLSAISYALEL